MPNYDAIHAYQDSLRAVESARRDVAVIAREIRHAAVCLKGNWQTVKVSGLSFGFATDAASSEDEYVINSESWPSAEEIGTALQALHAAIEDCRSNYNRIPQNDRMGIAAPPTKHGTVIGAGE